MFKSVALDLECVGSGVISRKVRNFPEPQL